MEWVLAACGVLIVVILFVLVRRSRRAPREETDVGRHSFSAHGGDDAP